MIPFEPYRVTLFGHRYIDCFREVEENLERVLGELSLQHPYMDFYVGNDGDFDLNSNLRHSSSDRQTRQRKHNNQPCFAVSKSQYGFA